MSTRKHKSNGQTVAWMLARGVGLAAALSLALATAGVSAQKGRTFKIQGIPATGLNDVCGEPIAALPPPLPPDTHFTFVGQFNPAADAKDAIPLSPGNCSNGILLATTTDPDFQRIFNLPEANPALKNLPLRDVLAMTTIDGLRLPLPAMGDVPADAPQFILVYTRQAVRSEPNFPITLGDWLQARGRMEIQCFPDGNAHVEAVFRKLLPNRLYSLNAIWLTPLPGTTDPTLVPLAFGGVPNAFMTNEEGSARFERDVNLCPMDPTPNGSRILFVDLGFHASSELHGVVPFRPLEAGKFQFFDGTTFASVMPPGIVTHVQMTFPITVRPLH